MSTSLMYPPQGGPYKLQSVIVGQSGNTYYPAVAPSQQVLDSDVPALLTLGWTLFNPGGTTSNLSPVTPVSRLPALTDNASLGYTTSSIWQYGGSLYTTPAYCGADSAAWAPTYESAVGTPADIMGTTLTKFAGGTCAMIKGYVGAAIDVAITIGGVYQIFTINILSTGELDNVSLGAVMEQADASTNAKVIKLYDQTGNNNHATLASAAGIPIVINGTITTSTTLTVNSVTTGTVVTTLLLFGNGVTPGTTLSSGTGPYTLSQASASNPGPEVMYLGNTTPPYIDWDPVLGRYTIQAPNEITNANTTNKRTLQWPQAMTITTSQNLGLYAVGTGVGSGDNFAPCLCSVGDQGVGTTNYCSILGVNSTNSYQAGSVIISQNGALRQVPVSIDAQPMVFLMSATSAPLTTMYVNEQTATSAAANANIALAGGLLFAFGGGALQGYSMMKLAGIAVFNTSLTATQMQQMRYGAYVRFNIYPQVLNQVAIIGDSRLASYQVTPGFGVSTLLPRYIGRNWRVIDMAIHASTVAIQIGDGLVPTVTGVAKSLQTFKLPGTNYALILLGVNDFIISAASVATVLANLQLFCSQIAAVGWTPILIAELTTTTSTNSANTFLPLLNAAIISAGSGSFSGALLVNLYGYTPIVTPANSSYYNGGLHPTPAVQQIITSAIAAYIK